MPLREEAAARLKGRAPEARPTGLAGCGDGSGDCKAAAGSAKKTATLPDCSTAVARVLMMPLASHRLDLVCGDC